jgi:hypothetical protein
MAFEASNHDGSGGSPGRKCIYLVWSGTTAHGDECVVGFANDLPEVLQAMAMLAPGVSAAKDEIRRDWPFPGTTEILRAWFDKNTGASRWLRATPTPHALDPSVRATPLHGRRPTAASVGTG